MALNDDQMIRVQCLQICSGSVAEAKNAYYWVMGEPNSAVKQQAGLIGASSQQARQEALQKAVASQFDGAQSMNARNPLIGG